MMESLNQLDYEFYLHCLAFAHQRFALEYEKYHFDQLPQFHVPTFAPTKRYGLHSRRPPTKGTSKHRSLGWSKLFSEISYGIRPFCHFAS